jgi:hypothetical protein
MSRSIDFEIVSDEPVALKSALLPKLETLRIFVDSILTDLQLVRDRSSDGTTIDERLLAKIVIVLVVKRARFSVLPETVKFVAVIVLYTVFPIRYTIVDPVTLTFDRFSVPSVEVRKL